MTLLRHVLRSSTAPAAAYIASTLYDKRITKPVEGKAPVRSAINGYNDGIDTTSNATKIPEVEELFHGMFPLRQLWKPRKEYPLWDEDWDGRNPESTGDIEKDRANKRFIRKHGVTRHIILVRHGQYDESCKEDEKRILTPLGRKQAALTGQRLAKMMTGSSDQCNVSTIRVSNMTRAKETADIIAKYLPGHVSRADPDPNLNEGVPCPTVPGRRISASAIKKTDEGHERIEKAFQSYFYRAEFPRGEEGKSTSKVEKDADDQDVAIFQPNVQHEFEIIVCHANVLRYFLTRALQIPPEAWLRLCTFNCSLTYITIRPTGTCSCRMLGDIGHLGYDNATFSMHHGFNW